jgi:ATP adenylyltransferase
MKQLYSPWRSKYIQTFKEKKKSRKCLFCEIAEDTHDAKNLLVWRGKNCFVVMNRFPYNSGHIMIVPYTHARDFSKLKDDELAEIMTTAKKCFRVMTKMNGAQGFNFGSNVGSVAGAGIADHIHFHIVPRWNGDTNFMPVLASIKIISEDIGKLYRQFRAAFEKEAKAGASSPGRAMSRPHGK